MRHTRLSGALAVAALAATAHAQAPAGNHALDFFFGPAVTTIPNTGDNAMFGWTFTVLTPIQVTALDVWDFKGDGFGDGSHQVGIWGAGAAPLVATVVTSVSPTHAALDTIGLWRFEPVTPTLLGPGVYTIGALYGDQGDRVAVNTLPPVTIPEISYGGGAFAQATGLPFSKPPTFTADGNSYFGPSFHAIGVNAPEPGSFALVVIGAIGVASNLSIRRDRRTRAKPS